jgi:hypothetical protein
VDRTVAHLAAALDRLGVGRAATTDLAKLSAAAE